MGRSARLVPTPIGNSNLWLLADIDIESEDGSGPASDADSESSDAEASIAAANAKGKGKKPMTARQAVLASVAGSSHITLSKFSHSMRYAIQLG